MLTVVCGCIGFSVLEVVRVVVIWVVVVRVVVFKYVTFVICVVCSGSFLVVMCVVIC